MGIEDTSARDPILHLLGSMGTGGTSGYIEEMEASGQRQVVGNEVMPNRAPWKELEALGFKPGEQVDSLFRSCELPAGWKKVPSDHSMWSYVVDEQGKQRVAIFYKAAFYDRAAFAHLVNDD